MILLLWKKIGKIVGTMDASHFASKRAPILLATILNLHKFEMILLYFIAVKNKLVELIFFFKTHTHLFYSWIATILYSRKFQIILFHQCKKILRVASKMVSSNFASQQPSILFSTIQYLRKFQITQCHYREKNWGGGGQYNNPLT